MISLEASYAHCDAIARARAKNFYYAFRVLPRHKRLAMSTLYAFMRECDDRSDEAGATLAHIDDWRRQLDSTLAGHVADHPIWPAFADIVQRFRIPERYFHEMIEGVSSDLEPRHVQSYGELYRYCYLVASVVGLTTIYVFGFSDPNAPALAEKCGIAFQLTNIIRDVGEDARNGRVYLPQDDLDTFGVTRDMLQLEATPEAVRRLLKFEAGRAREYYRESRPLIRMVEADSRPALWALIEIYSRLLQRIAAKSYDVLPDRIRLSTPHKLFVLAQAACGRHG